MEKTLHTGSWQDGCAKDLKTGKKLVPSWGHNADHKLLLDTGATDNISETEI